MYEVHIEPELVLAELVVFAHPDELHVPDDHAQFVPTVHDDGHALLYAPAEEPNWH